RETQALYPNPPFPDGNGNPTAGRSKKLHPVDERSTALSDCVAVNDVRDDHLRRNRTLPERRWGSRARRPAKQPKDQQADGADAYPNENSSKALHDASPPNDQGQRREP